MEPRKTSAADPLPPSPSRWKDRPSLLYQTGCWKLGLWAARHLPLAMTSMMGRGAAKAYAMCNPDRRKIVVHNLLPAVQGDHSRATILGRQLFVQFGQKIADLLRYESGVSVRHLTHRTTGWNHFTAAHGRGRGVLLLTPHLGNWELGAPLLAERGVSLLVITQMEPHAGLTELRQQSRAQRGVETLVIGGNPFAFVEVIRRLEKGATVALLMDRPPPASSVLIHLFDRPFSASVSAAELARATGCALVPTCIVREESGYTAHILPEIDYDRRAIASRETRRQLTQEIMRAFEPMIQQHLTQWYHFVPIWPEASHPGEPRRLS